MLKAEWLLLVLVPGPFRHWLLIQIRNTLKERERTRKTEGDVALILTTEKRASQHTAFIFIYIHTPTPLIWS